jgi:hypothetical protein
MYFGYFTLFSALAISAIAAWYSIIGLTAIFAAALIPIIVMGVALETGKVVTAVWLHRNWQRAKIWMRTYLAFATIVLMFITSMGIFGFLSKAHIEQTAANTETVAQIERVTSEIARNRSVIENADDRIKRLETNGVGADANTQAQIDKEQERIDSAYKRVEPAIAEQQRIIDNEAGLYNSELVRIDEQMRTLQGYIDNNEIKKAQGMVGTATDGRYGSKTAQAFKDWQARKQEERTQLLAKIENSKNSPKSRAARDEIKRIRKTVEDQVAQSNILISRLRSQLGKTQATNIDAEVDEQRNRIKIANAEIDTLTAKKFELESVNRKLEAEVGPVKYIAEFIYGTDADRNTLEEAVRWVIIVLVLVFDPLAICLILAGTQQIAWGREDAKRRQENEYLAAIPEPEPDYEQDDGPLTDEQLDEIQQSAWMFRQESKNDNGRTVEQPENEAEVSKDPEPPEEPKENFPVSEADLTQSNDLSEEEKEVEEFIEQANNLLEEEIQREETSNLDKIDRFVYPEEIVKNDVALDSNAGFPTITTHPSDVSEGVADDSTHPDTEGEPKVEPVTASLTEAQQEFIQEVRAVSVNKPSGKVLQTMPLFHAEPDNKTVIASGFGSVFPETNLKKGDMFLRTDYLPSKLFRFNGDNWIEISKELSTSYTYDKKYIEYLIEKIKTGEYELEDLSDHEQEQIQEYLTNNVQ